MGTTIPRKLVRAQRMPLIGGLATRLLALYGIEIPKEVEIGPGFYLGHGGFGVVITPYTTIGRNVRIYQGVTIGRADVHIPLEESEFERIDIRDEAIISAGAVVLGGPAVTIVGEGTLVGANAVLTQSTGDWEVWAGAPAKKVADRPRPTRQPSVGDG